MKLYATLVALQTAAGGAVWLATGPGQGSPLMPDSHPKLMISDHVIQPRASQLPKDAIDLDSLIEASLTSSPALTARTLPAPAAAFTGSPRLAALPPASARPDLERPAVEPFAPPRQAAPQEFKRAASLSGGQGGTSSALSMTPPMRDALAPLSRQPASLPAARQQALPSRPAANAVPGLPGVGRRVAYAPAAEGHAGTYALTALRSSASPFAAPMRTAAVPLVGPAVDAFPGGSSSGFAAASANGSEAGSEKAPATKSAASNPSASDKYSFYLNVARKRLGEKKLETYQDDGETILVALRESQRSNHSYPDKFVFLKRGKAIELSGSTQPSSSGTGISMIKPGVYVGVPNGPHSGAPSWWIKTESGNGALPDLRDSDGDGKYKGPGESYDSKATEILLHVGRSSIGCLNYRPEDTQKVVDAIGGTTKRFVLVLI